MAIVGARRDPFQVVLYIFFGALAFIMLYPFWHTLIGSLMSYDEYVNRRLLLWVSEPTLQNYRQILELGAIASPFRVTIGITVVGTVCSVFLTAFTAYGLSKRFPGSSLITLLIVFTMFVNAGMIPNYILMRNLGLLNTYAVYIVPSLINTFNLIVMRTYFSSFSHEVEESALLDGCGWYGIFFRIVLPLSRPMIATIGLFYAVQYWDTFFPSLFFVTDPAKQTLQHYLYTILSQFMEQQDLVAQTGQRLTLQTLRLANVMVTVLPIIVVYPFLQKHFVKGLMIGSIKG